MAKRNLPRAWNKKLQAAVSISTGHEKREISKGDAT